MSPIGAIFIWTVIGSFYVIFFWSLYLAITLKIETGPKLLYCIGIVLVQPLASLFFMGWYYNKFRTLRRR